MNLFIIFSAHTKNAHKAQDISKTEMKANPNQ
jgi:hypothetical protein